MKKYFLPSLILTLGFLITIAIMHASGTPEPQIDESQILTSVNESRSQKGLEPLAFDPVLEVGAQQRAEKLCTTEFSHADFLPQAYASGYAWNYLGENLGKDFIRTEDLIEGWRKSPTHFANFVTPQYKEIGIGIADCGNTLMVVQWFGQERQ